MLFKLGEFCIAVVYRVLSFVSVLPFENIDDLTEYLKTEIISVLRKVKKSFVFFELNILKLYSAFLYHYH